MILFYHSQKLLGCFDMFKIFTNGIQKDKYQNSTVVVNAFLNILDESEQKRKEYNPHYINLSKFLYLKFCNEI